MKKRVKPEKRGKAILYVFVRYLILVVSGIFFPFYKILLPLTIWPVYFLLSIFYNTSVIGSIILVSVAKIEIVGACVAGSAYYLLLILNLTTSMKSKQRIYSLLFSFFSLLILNILRIFSLSILYIEDFVFFDFTHKLFWYFLSIGFVVGIWFLTVWLFKIKNVPVYSDIKMLIRFINLN